MSADPSARIITIAGIPAPAIDEGAFVAAGAVIVGNVRLAPRSSVWYNAVLRACASRNADMAASWLPSSSRTWPIPVSERACSSSARSLMSRGSSVAK